VRKLHLGLDLVSGDIVCVDLTRDDVSDPTALPDLWDPITTKILALTDAFGNLISFRLMPDQAHDLRKTAELIEGITCEMFLADRAFDANWLRGNLETSGIEPIIPPKSNRKFPPEFDKDSYKWRHLIEN
jgi:transposase